jgi:hypothetical protein
MAREKNIIINIKVNFTDVFECMRMRLITFELINEFYRYFKLGGENN